MDEALKLAQKNEVVHRKKIKNLLDFHERLLDATMTLGNCAQQCLDRLRMLQIIDLVNKKEIKKYSKEWIDEIKLGITQCKLELYKELLDFQMDIRSSSAQDLLKADYTGHGMLSLFSVSTPKDHLRTWFIKLETDFFTLKCLLAKDCYIRGAANTCKFQKLGEEMEMELKDELSLNTKLEYCPVDEKFKTESNFYKVFFTDALDFLRNKSVYLSLGYMYVPFKYLWSCLATRFNEHLQERITDWRMSYVHDEQEFNIDERVLPIFEVLEEYMGEETTYNKSNLSITDLDSVVTSFPLCMSHIHKILDQKNHIKHGSRMQYIPFLKDIGIELDECIEFFEEKHAEAKVSIPFKKYAYSIRHIYGLEGKKKEKKTYNCEKILESSGTMDYGCPYKNWSSDVLQEELTKHGVRNVGEIVSLAKDGFYRSACAKCYQGCHVGTEFVAKSIIEHPNEYFSDSYKYNYSDDDW